jgi:two-component system chemotaxis response regulator CheB
MEAHKWLIGVGASGAAGLRDISALLSALPNDLNAIILIVLHRPSNQPSFLREVLASRSQMPVFIAEQSEILRTGRAYIGEPAAHLSLLKTNVSALITHNDATHRNRTVDLLFGSLASIGGEAIIGVVLSGSLDDGSRGLASIHNANGHTMALEPDLEHALNVGMPENAIRFNGTIDFIGSVATIADAIVRLVTMRANTAVEAV